jgi:hypothetical protein
MRTTSAATRISTILVLCLLTAIEACHRGAPLELRTDAGPLVNRLKLPSGVGAVRWVAVSPNKDTGWLPPRIEFYNVYAYIELDDAAWVALYKTIGEANGRDTLSLPSAVAKVLMPNSTMNNPGSSGSDVQIVGAALNASTLSNDPKKTEVQKAIRSDKALVVQFTAR